MLLKKVKTKVRYYDRDDSGPFDVCKRRDQGTPCAKKHGTLPSRETSRGETV